MGDQGGDNDGWVPQTRGGTLYDDEEAESASRQLGVNMSIDIHRERSFGENVRRFDASDWMLIAAIVVFFAVPLTVLLTAVFVPGYSDVAAEFVETPVASSLDVVDYLLGQAASLLADAVRLLQRLATRV
jgi:hypothetical protein